MEHEQANFEGVAGSIACDARHSPLVFMRFAGQLDLDLITRYDAWQNQHVAALERDDRREAWIADVRVAEVPSPEVRRFLAARWRVNVARYRSRVLVEYVVVDSSILRGVFTLFRMVNPSLTVDTFAVPELAVRRARAVLADAGIASEDLSAAQISGLFR